MRVLWALLVVSLATGGAVAQPLDVAPDTLFLQGETLVTVANRTKDSVRLDSLSVRGSYLQGYRFQLLAPDTTVDDGYLSPDLRAGFRTAPVGVALAPREFADFVVTGYDACNRCRLRPDEPYLFLFYSGGAAVPDTVVIDFSRFVSSGSAPDAAPPVRVAAFPNPAADRLTLRLETARPADAEVVVIDALGRVVWRQRVDVAAIVELPLPTRAFAAGPYRVRVRTAGGGAEASFTVVR